MHELHARRDNMGRALHGEECKGDYNTVAVSSGRGGFEYCHTLRSCIKRFMSFFQAGLLFLSSCSCSSACRKIFLLSSLLQY